MTDGRRGRPRLDDEERDRRRDLCRAWAAEIKRNSGLSAKNLARALGYGSGNDDADGRAWRALASGSRAPAPENFRRMTARASRNGWLDRLGYLRYSQYWSQSGEGEASDYDSEGGLDEKRWRDGTLCNALLMLMAHARRCGIDQGLFFLDARAALGHMESFISGLSDEEIELRARRVARPTVQGLLDGPEYPLTSLILEGGDGGEAGV